MFKKLLITIFVLFVAIPSFSQDFLGYNYSNFQTAGGMVFNPASIAGSYYKVNVNILSINVGAINNAYEFKKNKLFDDMIEGEDFLKNNSSGSKNLFMNVDILGPSFMIELGHKIGSVGFTSRIRVLASEKNLDNGIFQLLGDSNFDFFGKRFTQNDLMLDIHGFADYGLTYARTVWANNKHVLKGGATVKYVMGLAGGSFRADNLNVQIDLNEIIDDEKIGDLQGNVTLLYSDAIDIAFGDDSDFSDIWDAASSSSGFGFDVGMEYEWYRDGKYQPVIENTSIWKSNILTPYTLKASLSITDIGSVKYNPSENAASYSVHMSGVPTTELNMEEDDLNDYINRLRSEGYINEMEVKGKYSLSLPTQLRFNIDWKAYKGLFVNAGTTMNLLSKSRYGGRYANYYYITPRYENRWMTVYSPLSINSLNQFHWGFGVNLGMFFIGSGSIISNLFNSRFKAVDVHFGFSVPIRQKAKNIESFVSPTGDEDIIIK
ncbi:MAG: DUF5723 family protein [Prevotellaceae bacterium]|jgi:hypothetical protein|nr:DUF5723 family protein [Prevotellaceae bacterium]